MSFSLSFHAPPSLPRKILCTSPRPNNLNHLRRPPNPPETARRRSPPLIGILNRFPAARTVQQMMDTMDQIIEDPIEPVIGSLNGFRRGERTPWEIREGEGEYKMRFDVPGMKKGDVRVWVEERALVIRAEKAGEGEEEGGWPAASFGRYSSRILLPENAAVERIGAEVRDGVLYVNVPVASPKGKVVDIEVQ